MEDLWVTKAFMAQVFEENFCKKEPMVVSNKKQKNGVQHFTSWF